MDISADALVKSEVWKPTQPATAPEMAPEMSEMAAEMAEMV